MITIDVNQLIEEALREVNSDANLGLTESDIQALLIIYKNSDPSDKELEKNYRDSIKTKLKLGFIDHIINGR